MACNEIILFLKVKPSVIFKITSLWVVATIPGLPLQKWTWSSSRQEVFKTICSGWFYSLDNFYMVTVRTGNWCNIYVLIISSLILELRMHSAIHAIKISESLLIENAYLFKAIKLKFWICKYNGVINVKRLIPVEIKGLWKVSTNDFSHEFYAKPWVNRYWARSSMQTLLTGVTFLFLPY